MQRCRQQSQAGCASVKSWLPACLLEQPIVHAYKCVYVHRRGHRPSGEADRGRWRGLQGARQQHIQSRNSAAPAHASSQPPPTQRSHPRGMPLFYTAMHSFNCQLGFEESLIAATHVTCAWLLAFQSFCKGYIDALQC